MTTITAVTTPALRADDLSAQDYRDIYDELRDHLSLSEFIVRAGSTVSRSWWSQYEAGIKHLSWARKNELRRAVMPEELAPPAAVAAAAVTENAIVWRIGEGLADRVILVAPEVASPLFLSVNGEVHIVDLAAQQGPADAKVTPVTAYCRSRRPTVGIGGLTCVTRARHDARRLARGETWEQYLARLADVPEPQP
jgi:hypothetical protein